MTPRRSTLLLLGVLATSTLAAPVGGASEAGLPAFPEPVDPRSWVLPEEMTWDDYRPIPGVDWNDPARQPLKKLRAALILGDFRGQNFIVTQPEGSDLAGNPIDAGGIPREEVGDFYERFLFTEPSELNHGHTANEYWLENSYGLVGVDADAFGPYRLEGREHEYGLNDFNTHGCPSDHDCSRDFDSEIVEASLADVTAGMALNGGRDYDFRFLLHAGYDESGVWQEFGQMRFRDANKVTEPFGPPDPSLPNWTSTRYVDWTSWWAGKSIWSHALPGLLSTQGESDGQATYAHELSHIFGVFDNYNDPYSGGRSYSGPWDMMSRGTFNGPVGPHARWQIPARFGGSMGSHHMLRNKIRLGFIKPNEVLALDPVALAMTGPVFVDVWARSVPLAPVTPRVGLHGITIALAPGAARELSGAQHLTIEVVDRMGYDSFTPDHGVLIAETKVADDPPFIWVIDAHPEDIDRIDYIAPDGTPVPIGEGDYRHLSDALFHAGSDDVVSDLRHSTGRFQIYVLDAIRDEEGALRYRIAVRSTLGGGPFTRGVQVRAVGAEHASPGRVARYTFEVENTGNGRDLFGLAFGLSHGAFEGKLQHQYIEVGPHQTELVDVFVALPEDAQSAVLYFSAASETGGAFAQATADIEPV